MMHPAAFVPPPVIATIPDLSAVVAGIFALILVFALYLLEELITNALSRIPLIGGPIGSFLNARLEEQRDAMEWTFHTVMNDVSQLFHGGASLVWTLHTYIGNAFWAISENLHVIADVKIPNIWATMAKWTTEVRKDAWAYAQNALALAYIRAEEVRKEAWQYSQTAQTNAYARAEQVRKEAWQYSQSALKAAYARAEQVRQQAWAYSQAALKAAYARSETVREDAFQYATDARNQAIATTTKDIDASLSHAVSPIWAGLVPDLKAAISTAGDAEPGLKALLQQVPTEIGPTAAAALAAVASLGPPMMHALDDCVIPQCTNLSGLSKFLHDLLAAGFDLALLAWLIYVVNDPVAAAADTNAVASPIVDPIADALAALMEVL